MSERQIREDIFGTDTENYAQRVPCVVVMDCSFSMEGKPIESLNAGLKRFEEELKADPKARRSARVMLIRVGGFKDDASEVSIRTPFQDVTEFQAPQEVASGTTPLGAAVLLALEKIEQEKQMLRTEAISYHRPWLFVISDGSPTDENAVWERACSEAMQAQASKKVSIFPIAVEGGNDSELQRLTTRSVAKMESMNFSKFFVWLSRSIGGASGQNTDTPQLQYPDWAKA